MTDHHDFADHDHDHGFGDDHHDEPLAAFEEPAFESLHHDDVTWDDDVHHDVPEVHDVVPVDHIAEPIDAHTSEMPDLTEDPVDVFPPSVDVGALPEPVDGFPWIDSGSLGLADIQAALHEADATDPVQPAELAEYAATDLPPGVDPWAALADSDDPATAALAKWWQQN